MWNNFVKGLKFSSILFFIFLQITFPKKLFHNRKEKVHVMIVIFHHVMAETERGEIVKQRRRSATGFHSLIIYYVTPRRIKRKENDEKFLF